ncbi:MAG: hypothetical protein MTP17_03450 [Candidatus Midichloria sp.]|nr:MAG: hypothetical protein MTP17_03450 [Candidatus Midichloria sp.]
MMFIWINHSLYRQYVIDSNEDAMLIIQLRRWVKSLNFDILKKFFGVKVD